MASTHATRWIGAAAIAGMVLAMGTYVHGGTYSGGSGAPGNPYQISTIADWQELIATPSDWNRRFILTADLNFGGIPLTPVAPDTNPSASFFQGTPFTGVFDGNGHVLSHAVIHQPTGDYVGLFGYLGSGGEIRNLGVENVDIAGHNYVGILCGWNYFGTTISRSRVSGTVSGNWYVGNLSGYNVGAVIRSFATGTVTGIGSTIGGLCGYNDGTISQSYATGAVTGNSYVGGLCGISNGTISQSYAIGAVTGSDYAGGLCGFLNGGLITDSYWDIDNANQTISAGGWGLSAVQMKQAASFFGWNDGTWTINEETDTPHLAWENRLGGVITTDWPTPTYVGSGTAQDPYQLTNATDLLCLGRRTPDWSSHFVLMGNIDLAGVSFTQAVIASGGGVFTGTFDGNGNTITNLTINGFGQDYLGLFSRIESGGQVQNINLVNVTLVGRNQIGGLCGSNGSGTIRQCSSAGTVSGGGSYGNVGGLCGYNTGTILLSTSTAAATGYWHIGGLCGINLGTINQSYSVSTVTGYQYVGGLCGNNDFGNIDQTYAAGAVTGNGGITGGLCGLDTGIITNSFWDTQTCLQSTSAGGTGMTTAQMKDVQTFLNAGWDFVSVWKMVPDHYPLLAWQPWSLRRYSGGSGTAADPWQIATLDDLNALAATSADWDKYFILTADLDLSSVVLSAALIAPDADNTQAGFQGIPFVGSFDGNFHVLRNLAIADSSGADFWGLFGQIGTGGQVRNLILANTSISATGNQIEEIGLLAGSSIGGTITQCGVSGSIDVALNNDNTNVGGLVGWQQSGSITQCYSTASVSGALTASGGLVGFLEQGLITDCYATGSVSGNFNIGGLVGMNFEGTIDKSYSNGYVNSSNGGGLVGWSTGTTTNSFWDIVGSQQQSSAGGTGLYPWDMLYRGIYENAGWDFNDASIDGNPAVWTIRESYSTPRLVWQPLIPGDLAGTYGVDLTDLMAMVPEWMLAGCSGCLADLNGDGVVNLVDLAILSEHWLLQP